MTWRSLYFTWKREKKRILKCYIINEFRAQRLLALMSLVPDLFLVHQQFGLHGFCVLALSPYLTVRVSECTMYIMDWMKISCLSSLPACIMYLIVVHMEFIITWRVK